MTGKMETQAERTQLMEIARQEVWNKTPFSYLRTGKKLTLLQIDTMLMVSDYLQQYIRDYFDLGLNRADAKPRALFTKYMLEHGIPPFRIYLADMNIDPANYKVVRKAIEEMNVLVDHPELDEGGRPTGNIIYSPVFTKFLVPQTGDFYRKRNEQGEVVVESARHSGYIEVEINKDVAQYAFDMSQGYANHPKLIARYASKQSTPKLYFKLQELMGKDKRAKVSLTVQEIKRTLGFEPFKDLQTQEWVVPYQKFAHFKSKVLDAVKEDLDRMAHDNHTDITFDYEPVYLNGRKRGDPDFIEFTIMSTDLGIGYSLLTKKDTPATGDAKKRTQAVEQGLFDNQYAGTWQRCMDGLYADTKDDAMCERFRQIVFEDYDKDSRLLTVQVPDKAYYEWIEGDEVLPHFYAAVAKHFGKGAKINYRLPK